MRQGLVTYIVDLIAGFSNLRIRNPSYGRRSRIIYTVIQYRQVILYSVHPGSILAEVLATRMDTESQLFWYRFSSDDDTDDIYW